MRRFESSRPSQAVRRLETLPSVTSEMPANGGLLRIGYRSPGSQVGRCGSEIADSLRRIFEIFPFLGDSDWRLGSIGTAWRAAQSYFPMFDDNLSGSQCRCAGKMSSEERHNATTGNQLKRQWRGRASAASRLAVQRDRDFLPTIGGRERPIETA